MNVFQSIIIFSHTFMWLHYSQQQKNANSLNAKTITYYEVSTTTIITKSHKT